MTLSLAAHAHGFGFCGLLGICQKSTTETSRSSLQCQLEDYSCVH